MKLEWDEIECVADHAFNVWFGSPERHWAKETWRLLEQQGFTSYDDDFDWHVAVFRFLALGGIYRDFCAVSWDEHTDRWYWDWVDGIELNPLIIGQMYGRETDDDYDAEFSHVLSALVELERPKVVECLKEVLGGELGLYSSLSASRSGDTGRSEDGVDDDVFAHLEPTGRNVNALCWVQEGCHPHLSE